MKYLIIGFTLAICFLSCSPQKQLQNLLEKHPELAKADTITILDTITTDQVAVDTSFKVNHFRIDTFHIVKEKLKIQVITERDSIYITGNCEDDTIYINKKVAVEKLLPCPPDEEKTFWQKAKDASIFILIGAAAVVAIGIIFRA